MYPILGYVAVCSSDVFVSMWCHLLDKFDPQGPINDIPALVQITAWRRPGDKPLSEPMVVNLLMHLLIIQPQWVKLCIYIPYDYLDHNQFECKYWLKI